MPAPYSLLDMPPGDFSNQFDYPAIAMAAAHNTFIQGINAVSAHAPHIKDDKVQPFVTFCLVLIENIHHHHKLEETYYFSAFEEKLGKGALSQNVEEHTHFMPQLDATEKWLKDVRDGKEKYDGQLFLQKLSSFCDTMVDHLNSEIPTLESSKLRAAFTEKELKAIEDQFMKLAMKSVDFYTTLPLSVVCANPATPWFPPFPAPMKWVTRWWFARKHKAAWEFGPMDLAGNPQKLPDPPASQTED